MTNSEFREKFEQYMTGTIDEKIKNVTNIITEASEGLGKKSILTENDFYDKSRRELEDIIYDTVYNAPNGSFILINNRIDAYRYDDGWIDTGYLYNIAKGAMYISNIFSNASNKDYLNNLYYLLKKSELHTIDILI